MYSVSYLNIKIIVFKRYWTGRGTLVTGLTNKLLSNQKSKRKKFLIEYTSNDIIILKVNVCHM